MKNKILFIFLFIGNLSLTAQVTTITCDPVCAGDGPLTYDSGFDAEINSVGGQNLTFEVTPTDASIVNNQDGKITITDFSGFPSGNLVVCIDAICPDIENCEERICFNIPIDESAPANCDCFALTPSFSFENITADNCEYVYCEGGATRLAVGDGTQNNFPSGTTFQWDDPAGTTGAITPAVTEGTYNVTITYADDQCLEQEVKTFTVLQKIITPDPKCPLAN